MKYLYLELNGYKRFLLNDVDHFAITITEALQLIIGTNGSGKSSLVHELSPMPAVPNMYTKTGSKLIKIEHNGRLYTLSSTFSPQQKQGTHSFFRDDVGEMNDGGTVTVQKDLIYHQFGYNADIHDVIQGKELFTGMGPQRRKEWFLLLNPISHDYAIKVYNKLRTQHRDAVGAINKAKEKLVEESEKLIQSDEEERLITEAKSLHDCLSHLLEHRKPVEKDLDNLDVEQGQLDDLLSRTARQLQSLLAQGPEEKLTVDVLDELIVSANEERVRCQALMEKHGADFTSNERKIKILQEAEGQILENLEGAIQVLTKDLEATKAAMLLGTPIASAKAALDAFQTVKLQLASLFAEIPSNKERKYSSGELTRQRELLSVNKTRTENSRATQARLAAKIAHMEEHKDHPDLQCPSCNHRFSLNYNETAYNATKAQLQGAIDEQASVIHPAIEACELYIKECLEYSQLYGQYTRMVQNWPILATYWDYLNEKAVVTDTPDQGLMYLQLIENDLLQQVHYEHVHAELVEKERLAVMLKDVGGADLQTLVAQNKELEVLLTDETHRLQQAATRLTQAQAERTRLKTMDQLYQRIQGVIQQKRGVNKLQIETIRRIEFNNAIRQIQSMLATREHVLNNLAMQKRIVEYVTEQITQLQLDEQALSILVKQMSPTEGLIAEGLLGFINNFMSQMNSFIRKIWTYPLVIKSCEVTEGASVDLDYKFPMIVERASNVVNDVAQGSDGMKEIVNLAFRLVAMKYLKLQDSPLMLDEFAKTFDETHRAQANNVIKALVEQHSHPQLFMVSHYESSYGALSNAQICVMNSKNITVPSSSRSREVNEHVVMR